MERVVSCKVYKVESYRKPDLRGKKIISFNILIKFTIEFQKE